MPATVTYRAVGGIDPATLSDRVWLSTKEAAAYSRMCLETVYRHIHSRRNRLPAVRRGHNWVIKRETLDKWLEGGSIR